MAKGADRLVGKWRIFETSLWDQAHLDLVGPAYIAVDAKGHGEMAFGALEASLDRDFTPTASTLTGTAPMKVIRSAATDGPICARTVTSKAKSRIAMATKQLSSPRHGCLFQQPARTCLPMVKLPAPSPRPCAGPRRRRRCAMGASLPPQPMQPRECWER